MPAQLPAPSADALTHSARLCELIRRDIRSQGGWIPFSRFMELALYAPGLGYYTAGARKFGEAVISPPPPSYPRCSGAHWPTS